MSTIDFAMIVSAARRFSGMTAAEFDWNLTVGDRARAALADAMYVLANQHLPVIQPGERSDELQRRVANQRELLHRFEADIDAMVAAAKGKSYVGWSDAARAQGQKIRYADTKEQS